MESKKFWESKTMIANFLAVIIIGLQIAMSSQMFDPEVQALLLAAFNLILRMKTTMPIA